MVNPFLAENTSLDVTSVWAAIDVLMAIGLVIALALKGEAGCRDENGQTDLRRYLSVNAVFYVTAAITILFLHNWVSLLAGGQTRWMATTRPGRSWTLFSRRS